MDPFQSRVWPGQKMPGNVGGKYKWACGLRVWRINHDESVLYVSGTGVPGKTGDTLQVCDTRIPGHRWEIDWLSLSLIMRFLHKGGRGWLKMEGERSMAP